MPQDHAPTPAAQLLNIGLNIILGACAFLLILFNPLGSVAPFPRWVQLCGAGWSGWVLINGVWTLAEGVIKTLRASREPRTAAGLPVNADETVGRLP